MKLRHVLTQTYTTFNGRLSDPMLPVVHEWIIAYHRKRWCVFTYPCQNFIQTMIVKVAWYPRCQFIVLNAFWILAEHDSPKILKLPCILSDQSVFLTCTFCMDTHIKDPFYKHRLTFITTSITMYSRYKIWDEITHLFPTFNGTTIEVWEWISNFVPYFT